MITVLTICAWSFLAIGFIINLAFVINPDAVGCPWWAPLPLFVGIALSIPIIWRRRRR